MLTWGSVLFMVSGTYCGCWHILPMDGGDEAIITFSNFLSLTLGCPSKADKPNFSGDLMQFTC